MFAEIRSDEIPEVPFQNFLFRGKKEEEAKKNENEEKKEDSDSKPK